LKIMLKIFKMNKTTRLLFFLALVLVFTQCQNRSDKDATSEEGLPNIVIIYMDDLGYGDVSAYGATELQTPLMDNWANGGMRFTKGYASSATCSPSRYALLTGRYPWRNE